jgi:hypothetical protein
MTWLREMLSDDKNGRLSSSRAIAFMAGSALSISTLALTYGSFDHPEMLPTLMAFGPSLAGLAAMNYGVQRWATKEKKSEV